MAFCGKCRPGQFKIQSRRRNHHTRVEKGSFVTRNIHLPCPRGSKSNGMCFSVSIRMSLREARLVLTCEVESGMNSLLFLRSNSLASSCTHHSCLSKKYDGEKDQQHLYVAGKQSRLLWTAVRSPRGTQECVDRTWRTSALRNMYIKAANRMSKTLCSC